VDAMLALRLKLSIAEAQKPDFRIPAYSEHDLFWNTKITINY